LHQIDRRARQAPCWASRSPQLQAEIVLGLVGDQVQQSCAKLPCAGSVVNVQLNSEISRTVVMPGWKSASRQIRREAFQ